MPLNRSKKERTPLENRLLAAYNIKTVKELAVRLETAYSTVVDWGKGKNAIPNDILLRISRDTRRSINWILTGEEEGADEFTMEVLAVIGKTTDYTEEDKRQWLAIIKASRPRK